jgi:hypothetical protein
VLSSEPLIQADLVQTSWHEFQIHRISPIRIVPVASQQWKTSVFLFGVCCDLTTYFRVIYMKL